MAATWQPYGSDMAAACHVNTTRLPWCFHVSAVSLPGCGRSLDVADTGMTATCQRLGSNSAMPTKPRLLSIFPVAPRCQPEKVAAGKKPSPHIRGRRPRRLPQRRGFSSLVGGDLDGGVSMAVLAPAFTMLVGSASVFSIRVPAFVQAGRRSGRTQPHLGGSRCVASEVFVIGGGGSSRGVSSC